MKTILTPQSIAQLPAAQRLAIGRQVMAQASATHVSPGSTKRVPNPFVDRQAFLTARQDARSSRTPTKLMEVNHVE